MCRLYNRESDNPTFRHQMCRYKAILSQLIERKCPSWSCPALCRASYGSFHILRGAGTRQWQRGSNRHSFRQARLPFTELISTEPSVSLAERRLWLRLCIAARRSYANIGAAGQVLFRGKREQAGRRRGIARQLPGLFQIAVGRPGPTTIPARIFHQDLLPQDRRLTHLR